MPAFPGIPGFIAFAGVKFGGYCLAGLALKKVQPAITVGVAKIAATRTGLGIVIGPLLTAGFTLAMGTLFPKTQEPEFPLQDALYPFIFIVRIAVWAFVINFFTKETTLAKSKLWGYAALGAVWSCILDVPGFELALIAPGQIPICEWAQSANSVLYS